MITCSSADSPAPPYSFGHPVARYPPSYSVRRQSFTKSISAGPSSLPIPPQLAGSFSAKKAWTFSR